MKTWILGLALLLAFAPAGGAAEVAARFDFEQGEAGQAPAGWAVTPDVAASYAVKLSDEKPEAGRFCAVLASTGTPAPQGFGVALKSLDPGPFRGKRVRFRGAVRVELGATGQRARLVLGSGNVAQGGFEATSLPVLDAKWAPYEVVGEIPKDARALEVGFVLVGDGKAFLDSAVVEVIGEAGAGNEAARPLPPRGLDNLTAFARVFGYVRYFHPSDQAAAADWESLALAGVQSAEKAATPEELARSLEDFFRPIAPTVRVFPTGKPLAGATAPPAPPGASPKTIWWEHLGVGLTKDQRSIYHSNRVSTGESAPDPARPFAADLGGGVSASLPLALYVDDQGTLPHPLSGSKPPAPATPEGFLPSGNDRATRLADVVLAWNAFQHFYPYFDVVGTDWPAELRKGLTAAAGDADERAFLPTLRRLVAALHDGHGNVFHPKLSDSHTLPLLWDWVEDQLVITRVAPGAPAGLAVGDVVVSLDGKPAREVLAAREELVSGATPQWRRWVALQALTAGPEKEEVKLAVRHAGGKTETVAVRHSLSTTGEPLAEPRPEKIAEVRPGILYVDLDRVTDDDFKGALDRLAAAKGVIFDLRGYPKTSPVFIAHIIGSTVTSARWNVPIVTRPDRQDVRWQFSNWPVEPLEPRLKGKIAFLTDGRAISYAETCMGIIENYKLAAIVGGPTAGTNGNINPFQLPGGYRLVWTGMKVLKHDGSRHHGVGIQPTVPVARTLKGVQAGRDEVLEKGIEVVSP